MGYFQFESLLTTSLQVLNEWVSNFITFYFLVNSKIMAINSKKSIPLLRSHTCESIKFLSLKKKLNKFKISFSFINSAFRQVSPFDFQSFISLIRPTSFTFSPHQHLTKIMKIQPISQHQIYKRIKVKFPPNTYEKI